MIWQCHGLCRKRTHILNYRIIYNSIILAIIINACFILQVQAQESIYFFDMKDAQGSWEHEQLDKREVISTDQAKNAATVLIDVPNDGNYQLLVSLYHNWREYCPFLYFKAKDSQGFIFSDYIFSESRFYMPIGKGRWEYRSPSASPYWYLHKGRAKIKFWVESKNDCWEGRDMPMEAKVYIDKFLLILLDEEQMMHPSVQDENNITK